jgi:hypothetical protein
MTHFRALSRDRTRRTAPIDSSIGDKDRKEIGSLAVWQLSSAKSSCGVEQLRDGNLDTYWQYDELHLDQSYHAKRLLIDKPMCARALCLSVCVDLMGLAYIWSIFNLLVKRRSTRSVSM